MKKILFTIVLVLAFALTACASGVDETAASAEVVEEEAAPADAAEEVEEAAESDEETGDKVKFGVSYAYVNMPSTVYQVEQFEEQAAERGYELVLLNADNNVEKQLADVEDLIEQECDVIAMFPVDENSMKPAVDAVNEAGIPLIMYSYAVTGTTVGEDYLAVATGDNKEQGVAAAEWIEANWEAYGFSGEKKAIMLEGPVGSGCAMDRGAGFVDTAEELGFTMVASQTANWSRSEAKDVVTNLIQSTGGDFNVIYSQNEEMILGAIAALKEAGIDPSTVMTIGIDATFEVADTIKAGELSGVVIYDMAELISGTFDTYEKWKAGEDFPEITGLTLQVLCNENVDEILDSGLILY